ncbi:pentapeptide repeat-containing protein [Dapis sp. BLCC M126]|uniref:pentapeptide repeat-containing protein n=1 Tax=Dapis sp. BLCC M126 TaxID=3400189 RepID=UPI003CEB9FDC
MDLTKADIRHAQLDNANLRGADLISADLRSVIPYQTDLSEANLTNASPSLAFWNNTKLTGAIMQNGSVHE